MDIVGLVQKGHGANGGEEGAGPGGTTVETVGVFNAGHKVAFDAFRTYVFMARITLDLLTQDRCVGLRTDSTGGCFYHDILRLLGRHPVFFLDSS